MLIPLCMRYSHKGASFNSGYCKIYGVVNGKFINKGDIFDIGWQ